jgi:hypothetical protein
MPVKRRLAQLRAWSPMRVRVLVLFASDDEWNEAEWLHAAAHNPAFAYLAESQEDIYTLSDGKAFDDESANADTECGQAALPGDCGGEVQANVEGDG